ncbi:MAG: PepSY domain-containing protein [Povalibacter sp.]|jgi:uncharacterized membrane protein YkoI
MSHRLPLLALLSFLTLAVGIPAANGQTLIDRRPRSERQVDRPRVSLDEAVSMAESRYRAKAVKASSSINGDRLVYNIRLLNSDGRVWTVSVDAQSGQMY